MEERVREVLEPKTRLSPNFGDQGTLPLLPPPRLYHRTSTCRREVIEPESMSLRWRPLDVLGSYNKLERVQSQRNRYFPLTTSTTSAVNIINKHNEYIHYQCKEVLRPLTLLCVMFRTLGSQNPRDRDKIRTLYLVIRFVCLRNRVTPNRRTPFVCCVTININVG